MRRTVTRVLVAVVLGVGGFTAAAFAAGSSPLAVLAPAQDTTGTTETTATTATTGTTGTTTTTGKKVWICHRTHSKKHPFVTITVSNNAVPAHLRHGDLPGRCTAAKIKKMKRIAAAKARKAKAKAKHRHGHGSSGGKGKGHGE